ncbi:nuclear transport factor 2 family protein [Streptosporangium sp. NPDC023825]|uniref:YybH family protein n=1 Tax=Streptosporangium sp. NPDC023825 TaxID=3154909 RepID=UPI0034432A94
MDHAELRAFADRWIEDWNAHDVEAVLSHFAEDVLFTSPTAAVLVPGSGGVVRGKAALREYWAAGLRSTPGLRFEMIAAYAGIDTLVINYRNLTVSGRLVNEVLVFDGPLVVEGHATHLDA